MARPITTPAQRASNVALASTKVEALTKAAIVALSTYGASDARTRAAWDAVEVQGAIIHRQSRLLAGKSKGG